MSAKKHRKLLAQEGGERKERWEKEWRR